MADMRKGKRGYSHLSQVERMEVEILHKKGYSIRDIARVIKRSPATVSREIKRNRRRVRTKKCSKAGPYEALVAQHKAFIKRRCARFEWKKINEEEKLRNYIVEGLKHYWGPDEISGQMRKTKQPFYASKTAIYEWLRSSRGQYYCQYLYTGRYRIRKQNKNKTNKALIPNRISIHLRPEVISQNVEYGHYESDTIVSGKKTGSKAALSVIYERKARYLDIKKINNLRPGSNREAVSGMASGKIVKSITFDNGIENTKHEELGAPTYFCDPYSSWQKGGIENGNKMIRRFIPKGSDINDYSDEYVSMVVNILNNKPRKSLGYKTAYEVMVEKQLFINPDINNKKTTPSVALRG